MTTKSASPNDPSKADAPVSGEAVSSGVNGAPKITLGMPIVYRIGKKKKSNRRYTRGLKQPQKLERGIAKATSRVARALSRGAGDYWDRSQKSSGKKRDGAIRDALENWSRALGKTGRVASRAPNDVIKRVNTKPVSRAIRQAVRLVVPPFFR